MYYPPTTHDTVSIIKSINHQNTMAEESPAKRLRSVPPDVTVIVGTAPEAQSFSVYKIALCFASPYFDTMLSSGMREDNTNSIELPDKDPEEWKAFYSIIDPSQIGQVRSESKIDEDNAVMLTKWFHEFQMVRGSPMIQ